MATRHPELADRVAPGENALLLCPSFQSAKSAGCRAMLTADDPEQENVLWVSFARSPSECWTDWHRHTDTVPADAIIIDVDDGSQSLSTETNDEFESDPALTIEKVSTPTDMTAIGTRLTEHLTTWAEKSPDRQTVVCLDSMTVLLQYTGVEQTYRFLDAVTETVAANDAIAHCHMDPTAADRETVRTLVGAFDECWRYDDGEWQAGV
jgi:hypothetical protein